MSKNEGGFFDNPHFGNFGEIATKCLAFWHKIVHFADNMPNVAF